MNRDFLFLFVMTIIPIMKNSNYMIKQCRLFVNRNYRVVTGKFLLSL